MTLYYKLLQGYVILWHYSACELHHYNMPWLAMELHKTIYFGVFATDCWCIIITWHTVKRPNVNSGSNLSFRKSGRLVVIVLFLLLGSVNYLMEQIFELRPAMWSSSPPNQCKYYHVTRCANGTLCENLELYKIHSLCHLAKNSHNIYGMYEQCCGLRVVK